MELAIEWVKHTHLHIYLHEKRLWSFFSAEGENGEIALWKKY